jgi:predicted RNA-binding protein with PIN domain
MLQKDLETARNLFIHNLSIYRSQKMLDILVVFDGAAGIPVPHQYETRAGIRIMFSRAPQKADPVIINLIRKAKQRRSLIVVTNDREIISFAKSAGSQTLSPKELADRMSAKPRDDQLLSKIDNHMSDEELEEWKKIFGVK